jgi:hypothetical protein
MVGVGTVLRTLLFGHLQPRRRRGVISYWLWLINSLAIAGWRSRLGICWPAGSRSCAASASASGCRLGDDAAGDGARAPARTSDQPRFLRQLRPDADRLAIWGAIAGIAPPGPMIAVGALVSAAMITSC